MSWQEERERERRTIEEVGLQLAPAQVVRARVAVDAARDDKVIADEDARDRVARLVEHLERRAVLRPAESPSFVSAALEGPVKQRA